MMRKKFLFVALFSAFVVGCGGSSSSTSTTDSNSSDTSTPNTDGGSGEQSGSVAAKYVGTYLLPCMLDDPEEPGIYSVTTSVVTQDTITSTGFIYTDAACTVPDTPAQVVTEFSIIYPGGTQQTDRGLADFVDVTLEEITSDGQPLTDAQRQVLQAFGGFNTSYDILLLEGSSLYVGEFTSEFDGNSEETRPQALEPIPGIRQ